MRKERSFKEDAEKEMDRKFIEGTTKGLAMKLKAKKGKY